MDRDVHLILGTSAVILTYGLPKVMDRDVHLILGTSVVILTYRLPLWTEMST